MTCLNCGGTGATRTPDIFDCVAPGCDVAERRTALEQAIKQTERQIGPMTPSELAWFAYNWKFVSSKPLPLSPCYWPECVCSVETMVKGCGTRHHPNRPKESLLD